MTHETQDARVKLTKIKLRNGGEVSVPDGVTVIVGPSGAGKTTLLHELHQYLSLHGLSQMETASKIVNGVTLEYSGDVDSYIESLKKKYRFVRQGDPMGHHDSDAFRLSRDGLHTVSTSFIRAYWGKGRHGLGELSKLSVSMLTSSGRTDLLQDENSHNSLQEVPQTPRQHLYAKPDLERRISELSQDVFETPIFLNRHAGTTLPIHVGSFEEDELHLSQEAQERLFSMPTINSQGDGFKAFMGMATTILTGAAPIMLIDEPEIHLHPPQARRFGKFLASLHAEGVQIIVVTHSDDILNGAASVAGNDVTILRMTRGGDQNAVAQLPAEEVRDLYNDPLMRYYNMLDGLFAHGVVLCEADSDCTFYTAVLENETEIAKNLDLHFTHCGGKGRLPKAIAALKKVGVPTACIVDIDILEKEGEFRNLTQAVGADVNSLEPLRRKIADELNEKAEAPSRSKALKEITSLLTGNESDPVDKNTAKSVREVIDARSAWRELKKNGIEAIGQGATCPLTDDGKAAFEEIYTALSEKGVFIVRVGELESFHPDLGISKKRWLGHALENEIFKDSPLAGRMLVDIASYIQSRQASEERAHQ